ncbi:DUF2141 domain-containing protein [Azospira restricta]|uniref:DUF2141 domain-containing protein n=1 Tax=Azospira restricta TaxID=404405 RepID=A0A974SPU8_9RHOO|nr:DUF2141 domain-containing protein [Azospira restricta]QRJ64276.1 DUF2141 domain-containing protein [Azospira restricta]
MSRIADFLHTSRLFLLGSLALAQPPAFAGDDATLTVTLQNVRDARGALRAGLYRDPATFRKEDQAVSVAQVPAAAGAVSLVFRDLPPGRYAVMAYHDENGDGTLNRRFGMFPSEGYGLSNNPQVAGPPAFADSAFEVAAPATAIAVELRY